MAQLSTFFDDILCSVLSAPGTGSFSLSTIINNGSVVIVEF